MRLHDQQLHCRRQVRPRDDHHELVVAQFHQAIDVIARNNRTTRIWQYAPKVCFLFQGLAQKY